MHIKYTAPFVVTQINSPTLKKYAKIEPVFLHNKNTHFDKVFIFNLCDSVSISQEYFIFNKKLPYCYVEQFFIV